TTETTSGPPLFSVFGAGPHNERGVLAQLAAQALHARQLRAPARLVELCELDAAQAPRSEPTAGELARDLLAAHGELAAGLGEAAAARAPAEWPAAPPPLRLAVGRHDQVEAPLEQGPVAGQASEEGDVVPRQLGERLRQLGARAALQIGEVALDLDGQHADEDLDREGQAVQKGGVAGQDGLLLPLALQAEVHAAHLQHGAVLPAGQPHDVVLDRLQADARALYGSRAAHRGTSRQPSCGAISAQSAADACEASSSSAQGHQTLDFGVTA